MMVIQKKHKKVFITIFKQKASLAIALMLLVMLFFNTSFYTAYNWMDMLKSAAILEIIAFGVTMTIVCGAFDLSVGGTMSLAGVITIKLMDYMPMVSAMLCALLAGMLIGLINGFFVAHQKTEPFIITLGMGMFLKGLSQQLTDAHSLPSKNLEFLDIANGKLFGVVPNLIVIMFVVMVALHLVLRHTQFGRNCYATGGDYEVAKYSGINVVRTKWLTYVICGITAAVGGILLSSKLNTASSLYGETTALTVSCGAVMGGTSFTGGTGGILYTFIGVIVLQILVNVMNMLGIDAYVQQFFEGVVIVAIIWSDCYAEKRHLETV
jgi:ribose transport system permease protein